MEQGLIRRLPRPGLDGPRFRDAESGDQLTAQEAVDRYLGDIDPRKLPVPKDVLEFVRGMDPALIEVNRLRSIQEAHPERYTTGMREPTAAVEAADYYARDLARRITVARSKHAVDAQKLDASYPGRLLQGGSRSVSHMEVANLQTAVQELSRRLERAALLEPDTSLTAINVHTDTEPWKLSALSLHYLDSLEKLKQLRPLADRILLFHELVSGKLAGKQFSISADQGYLVETANGPLRPSDLSSGEQHEIVMTYRLIFDSQPQQLVMIDEPEVSLHVKWQRKFLDDLRRIAGVDGLRFIVATHSPQIVGGWTDRMVAIGGDVR